MANRTVPASSCFVMHVFITLYKAFLTCSLVDILVKDKGETRPRQREKERADPPQSTVCHNRRSSAAEKLLDFNLRREIDRGVRNLITRGGELGMGQARSMEFSTTSQGCYGLAIQLWCYFMPFKLFSHRFVVKAIDSQNLATVVYCMEIILSKTIMRKAREKREQP